MPIIPLKTYRVLEMPKYNLLGEDDQSKEYKMLPIKLDIIQIIETFLSYWGGLLATILILFLLVKYELLFPLISFLVAIGFVMMVYYMFFKRNK